MNWSQAWKDFAQCRACMYPISASYHHYSTFSWFLTHTLYISQSLIWGQKQYLWCREGLLIPLENSGTPIPHFFFSYYIAHPPLNWLQMKDLYQDLFLPSSSNFYLWPTLELQALHPGAHGPGVISKVRTHPVPSWILHSQLSTPFLIHSSLFQNYHLQLAISTMHLLLLNPFVYWNLWRPQTVIFSFFWLCHSLQQK